MPDGRSSQTCLQQAGKLRRAASWNNRWTRGPTLPRRRKQLLARRSCRGPCRRRDAI